MEYRFISDEFRLLSIDIFLFFLSISLLLFFIGLIAITRGYYTKTTIPPHSLWHFVIYYSSVSSLYLFGCLIYLSTMNPYESSFTEADAAKLSSKIMIAGAVGLLLGIVFMVTLYVRSKQLKAVA
jgi:hypothetical protein